MCHKDIFLILNIECHTIITCCTACILQNGMSRMTVYYSYTFLLSNTVVTSILQRFGAPPTTRGHQNCSFFFPKTPDLTHHLKLHNLIWVCQHIETPKMFSGAKLRTTTKDDASEKKKYAFNVLIRLITPEPV